MRLLWKVAGTAMASGILFAAPAGAITPLRGGTSLNAADREYLHKSALGANSEVTLGRLVERRAHVPQVKQFGQQMVRDHGREKRELVRVNASFGQRTPTALLPDARQELAKLRSLRGRGFDREYINFMVNDHKQDIADDRKELRGGRNPRVKRLAAKMLPVLQMHLRMAQRAARVANSR